MAEVCSSPASQSTKVNNPRRCQGSFIFTASASRTLPHSDTPLKPAAKRPIHYNQQQAETGPSSSSSSSAETAHHLLCSSQIYEQGEVVVAGAFCPLSRPVPDTSVASDLTMVQQPHSRPVMPSHLCSPAGRTPSKFLSSFNQGTPRTPSVPSSQQKRSLPPSTKKIRLKVARKLKALENESKQDLFQEQDRREAWLNAQEKAYRAWLNHVLLKPMKPKTNSETDSVVSNASSRFSSHSELSYLSSESALPLADKSSLVSVDCLISPAPTRRTPQFDKRKSSTCKQEKDNPLLDASFQAICTLPVLRSRLEPFLDAKNREDVISTMINLAKHIDEGRLKMRNGCVILTDVALKEKFIQAMMNYNTPWLKIGLHVVLGHTGLLTQENTDTLPSEPEIKEEDMEAQCTLLRLIIEKHFLSHAGLAKYHATNKRIEGLYKPGYHDALGRVILKRILLFVLTLDKAKCQSTLPLVHGIDGLDGGSPLLFHMDRRIKSSRQALQELLLDAMYGEGDIVGHLGVLGYHVSHVQVGLVDYNFEVTDVIADLQDGIRICRLVQVLFGDPSILMKMKLPSDRLRRHHYNCRLALERLAKANVPLVDDHGCGITVEDVVEGDRERVIALLWNIMLHLQVPVSVSAQKLQQEICRIHQDPFPLGTLQDANGMFGNELILDLLLDRAQVEDKMAVLSWDAGLTFSNMKTCSELPGSCTNDKGEGEEDGEREGEGDGEGGEVMEWKQHGQAATKIQSAFRAFVLRQDFCQRRRAARIIQAATRCWLVHRLRTREQTIMQKKQIAAGIVIQAHWRSFREHRKFVQQKQACLRIQSSWRRFLVMKEAWARHATFAAMKIQSWWYTFRAQRSYLEQKNAAAVVQCYFRAYLQKQAFRNCKQSIVKLQALARGRHERRRFWKQRLAARTIQAWWRGCLLRRRFLEKRTAAIVVQSNLRAHLQRQEYRNYKEAVVKLQAVARSRQSRRIYSLYKKAAQNIQRCWREVLAARLRCRKKTEAATTIQSWWRQFAARKRFLEKRKAALLLQSYVRAHFERKCYLKCILRLQAWVRSRRQQRIYLKYMKSVRIIQAFWRQTTDEKVKRRRQVEAMSATTIQAWWRKCVTRRQFLELRLATIHIQSCTRSFNCRRKYNSVKIATQVIQNCVRSWLFKRKVHHDLAARQIQAAWRHMQSTRAAIVSQAHYRDRRERRSFMLQAIREHGSTTADVANKPRADMMLSSNLASPETNEQVILPDTCSDEHCSLKYGKALEVLKRWFQMSMQRRRFLCLQRCVVRAQRQWRHVLKMRLSAAISIQRHVRGWLGRKAFMQKKAATKSIQAVWRGFAVRHRHGRFKHELSELRQRMESTASNVDNKMRLENRLMEALAALLTQKTVSGILHICATIDLATQHSKLCCERLLEAGAISKILQLIQMTNRSPPHEEILKHALSILANLARYPEFAILVAEAPGSIAIVGEQLLRNNEDIISKVMRLLQLLCKVSNGLEALRRRPAVLKRLHNLSQVLEKKVEVEARALARLLQAAPPAIRKSGEKKVKDAVAQHHSALLLLQAATGEDFHARLKSMKRMSSIYSVPAAGTSRLSLSRFPLQDCSNK